MGDQQHGDAALGVQPLKDIHDLDTGPGVEVAGWLISQQNRWLVDERPRDRHALLLSTGELVGVVTGPVAEPDRLERRFGPPVSFLATHAVAVVQQRELDVVESRGAGEEIEALKDETDLLVSHRGQGVLRQL